MIVKVMDMKYLHGLCSRRVGKNWVSLMKDIDRFVSGKDEPVIVDCFFLGTVAV